MSAEPLTDEQLERVGAAAEALVAAWAGRDEAMPITPSVMAAWGERIARVDVPALLGEIVRQRVRIATLEYAAGRAAGSYWLETALPEQGGAQ